MKWKAMTTVSFILILGIGARWYADGAQIFTKTARQVAVRDSLFGTESVQWEAGLWVGLDFAGPAALALAALGAFGGFKAHRVKRLRRFEDGPI